MKSFFIFWKEFLTISRINKNMWRKVGDCGTFRMESGGSRHVHG
ncbi:hypothetical protein J2S07_002228 [Robertmurraya andreesenii]|uniref:Uncharacterized protein n=1 Tax=Anoxybacillus andreesenii TaxID=1325932 RepID=A0ABT9V4W4_9BACL|nr:hypothetical protein [Robertmurraya andreesenii]